MQWGRALWFSPDFHTDLEFTKTFIEVAPQLDWKAMALQWTSEFHRPTVVRECLYNDVAVRIEAEDRGDYLMVLQVEEPVTLTIGSKGDMYFEPGYYVYVGSAKANLDVLNVTNGSGKRNIGI